MERGYCAQPRHDRACEGLMALLRTDSAWLAGVDISIPKVWADSASDAKDLIASSQ